MEMQNIARKEEPKQKIDKGKQEREGKKEPEKKQVKKEKRGKPDGERKMQEKTWERKRYKT